MRLGVFIRGAYVFWGYCGDFVTLGVLTLWAGCDSLQAKITRSQHIYKGISIRSRRI